ncbi:hypothetical protein Tco_0435568 [Tanacetum coccineum]
MLLLNQTAIRCGNHSVVVSDGLKALPDGLQTVFNYDAKVDRHGCHCEFVAIQIGCGRCSMYPDVEKSVIVAVIVDGLAPKRCGGEMFELSYSLGLGDTAQPIPNVISFSMAQVFSGGVGVERRFDGLRIFTNKQ